MATLADVALSCAKQLGRVDATGQQITDLASEIKEEIAFAIEQYNRRPWGFLELRDLTVTTVAGQTWYSTVDLTGASGEQGVSGRSSVAIKNIVEVEFVRETLSSLRDGLEEKPYREFQRLLTGPVPGGLPVCYTRYAGQIGFYPQPSEAYTVEISAYVKPVLPSADIDTSVWFDEARELIEASACGRICLKYLRDPERAADFAPIAQGVEDRLHEEFIRKSASGRIRAHA